MTGRQRTPETVSNAGDVDAFLATVADPGRRADCRAVMDIMARVTGEPSVMWGSSVVGFGSCRPCANGPAESRQRV